VILDELVLINLTQNNKTLSSVGVCVLNNRLTMNQPKTDTAERMTRQNELMVFE